MDWRPNHTSSGRRRQPRNDRRRKPKSPREAGFLVMQVDQREAEVSIPASLAEACSKARE